MTLVEQLGLVQRRIERLVRRRIAARTDRPFLQLRALRVIRREDLRTQAAFAERLLIDAPAASRLIDRLVDQRLARRRPGADRRCVCLEITPEGARQLAILDEAVRFAERTVLGQLGAGRARALAPLLRALAEGLDEPAA